MRSWLRPLHDTRQTLSEQSASPKESRDSVTHDPKETRRSPKSGRAQLHGQSRHRFAQVKSAKKENHLVFIVIIVHPTPVSQLRKMREQFACFPHLRCTHIPIFRVLFVIDAIGPGRRGANGDGKLERVRLWSSNDTVQRSSHSVPDLTRNVLRDARFDELPHQRRWQRASCLGANGATFRRSSHLGATTSLT